MSDQSPRPQLSSVPDDQQTIADPPAPGIVGDAGTEANARLTAIAGGVVFVLLAVEGVSIPAVRQLFGLHVFVGVLLIPPVLLKVGSTGYRFVRYYTGSEAYRRTGPPLMLLRALGPVLVLSTLTVLGTGVLLLVAGPHLRWARTLHTASFIAFFVATSIHVLAHVRRELVLVAGDLGARRRLPGRPQRWLVAAGSLLVGLAAALVAVRYDGTWLHWFATRDHHRGGGSG